MPINKYRYLLNKAYKEPFPNENALVLLKDGYGNKFYSIRNLLNLGNASVQKEFVDMGRIYMTPIPVGQENNYESYYSTLGFCQPNESQLEVACIPVPKGKTYEEVSPNRPLK